MILKVLILYYLSIKPTHGYEIQRFIQLNQMDSWTKIQSGSIYYALAKLEKNGLIILVRLDGKGMKARKIYSITEKGSAALQELVKEMLQTEISEVGSDKFIIYPLLNTLDRATMVQQLQAQIQQLKKKKEYFEKWREVKVNAQTLKVEKISFEMMISNLDYQIQWHLALIEQMDDCVAASKSVSKLIKDFDFSNDSIELSDPEDLESFKQCPFQPKEMPKQE